MSDETHLYQWRYTDQFGKRRTYPCLLSEEEAARLTDPEKIEGTLEVRRPVGGMSHLMRKD